MVNMIELSKLVQSGAKGDSEQASKDAVEACRIIEKEQMLFYGFQTKTAPFAKPNPNDKGFKMKAKRTGTNCLTCDKIINEGDDIFWKKGTGATHVTCVP